MIKIQSELIVSGLVQVTWTDNGTERFYNAHFTIALLGVKRGARRPVTGVEDSPTFNARICMNICGMTAMDIGTDQY